MRRPTGRNRSEPRAPGSKLRDLVRGKQEPDEAAPPIDSPYDAPYHEPVGAHEAVTLTIVSLDLSGSGPNDEARIALRVNVRHDGSPRLLRTWQLTALIAGRQVPGQHVADRRPPRALPTAPGGGGAAFPVSDDRVRPLQFVLPTITRQQFEDGLAGAELVVVAIDELGETWSTRLHLRGVKGSEQAGQ